MEWVQCGVAFGRVWSAKAARPAATPITRATNARASREGAFREEADKRALLEPHAAFHARDQPGSSARIIAAHRLIQAGTSPSFGRRRIISAHGIYKSSTETVAEILA